MDELISLGYLYQIGEGNVYKFYDSLKLKDELQKKENVKGKTNAIIATDDGFKF